MRLSGVSNGRRRSRAPLRHACKKRDGSWPEHADRHWISIRLRQFEHALGDVGKNELRADGGDAGDLDFAEVALDMVFAGVAHAAMRHDRGLAGTEPGFGGAVLGGIGPGADRAGVVVAVVAGGSPQYHQFGRFELDPALGEQVLDRLVLADGPTEYDA